jgi:hypothetical protein
VSGHVEAHVEGDEDRGREGRVIGDEALVLIHSLVRHRAAAAAVVRDARDGGGTSLEDERSWIRRPPAWRRWRRWCSEEVAAA